MNSVLVVDDDPIHVEVTSAQFMAHGACRFVTISSGREAEQQLSKDRSIELLMLDLNMPDSDGAELPEHLQARGFRSPSIITGAAQQAIRHAGITDNSWKIGSGPRTSPILALHG